MRRSTRFRRIFLLTGLLVVVVLFTATLFYRTTLTWMAKFLTLSQSPEPADVILVLGGDFWGPRAVLGAELGARGYAKKVLISGPPYVNMPESVLSIRFLVEKGYPREMFLGFPHKAKSTIEEAIALCPELRRLGARNVLLVTTEYHSRRANIVFRLFCPACRFRSVAAPDDQFHAENWWENDRFRKLFFSEWEKIIGTVVWEYPLYLLKPGASRAAFYLPDILALS